MESANGHSEQLLLPIVASGNVLAFLKRLNHQQAKFFLPDRHFYMVQFHVRGVM
jgi:hypothetical protein